MKRVIVLVAAIACMCSCSKDKSHEFSVVGRWELVMTDGGFGGIHMTPAQMGRTKQYVFRSDLSCEVNDNGTVSNTTYSISTDTSELFQSQVTMMKIGSSSGLIFSHSGNDTIRLGEDHLEPFTYTFVRK